ncbi:MAG TPA: hypothetical protein VNE39_23070 [Planctomycetota bacterium]|nr:hypothetical protein [Planctomycetota bacterium]
MRVHAEGNGRRNHGAEQAIAGDTDNPRDVWIAVGGGDKAKVWINDILVWVSGGQHKGWRADEGFRKVHPRKGYNRVLFRLENGHLGTAFSLTVCTKPNQ